MKNEKKFQFEGKILPFTKIGIAILGILILSLIISRLIYPFDVGVLEAFSWMAATHLLEGKNPYAFAFTPPYSMSPYGIVYYALTAIGLEIFGYQIWFGRILSVLGFIVCIWAITRIVRKLAQGREAIWFTAFIGLAMFPGQFAISLMRSDLIAAAFAFSALAVVFTIEENKKISFWRIIAAILLSSAAFFTKQTYLLSIGVIFLRFLQLKKWRESMAFAFGVAFIVFGGVFLLNQTSSGGYVWQHFTHAQRLPHSFAQSVEFLIIMLKHPTFLFSLVCLIIFFFHHREFLWRSNHVETIKLVRSAEFLIFGYLLISLVWSFISAGRIGAGTQYYIENSFLLAIVVGLILEYFKRKSLPNVVLVMIFLFTFGGAFQIFRILRGEYYRWQSLSYYQEIFKTVGEVVPPNSKCISIAPEIAVWNGCTFNFDDFGEYYSTWDPELTEIFEREVKAGRYTAVLWMDDKFTERFPNYRLVKMSQSVPYKYYPIYLYVRE
jgi:4-amino-4-deoxy-L-arabinose transferase-like glycosyltransferase